MAKTAFIYPGQGAQHPGMGKDFFDAFPSVRERFSACSALLSTDMETLCFTENEALNDTRYTQPAMVLMELALTEVLKQETSLSAEYSAGLSLGEYAALWEAGVMSFEDALRTVSARGRLMAEAVPTGEGAMAAVLGMEAEAIEAVLSGISGAYIANYNCPGQIVITGRTEAVEKASEALVLAGARKCVPLKVSGPFHSPLLSGVGDALSAVLEGVCVREPAHPYLANVTAEPVTKAAEVKPLLREQVSSSVRWQQSVERMLALGVDTFVEIGPGKTLSGFMRKILKAYGDRTGADMSAVRTFQVETPEDLAKLRG